MVGSPSISKSIPIKIILWEARQKKLLLFAISYVSVRNKLKCLKMHPFYENWNQVSSLNVIECGSWGIEICVSHRYFWYLVTNGGSKMS